MVKPRLNPKHSPDYEITDIGEKPVNNPPSILAVIGRYVFEPSIFKYLELQKPGVGGEIQLTDEIKAMLGESNCYGFEVEGERYDIANISDYVRIINCIYQSTINQ